MKRRVLIVEDHPFQLQILAELFSSRPGIEVDACLSANEAATLCMARVYDLVVSDLQMPGMDGVQFIQLLSTINTPPLLALVSSESERVLVSAKLAAQSLGLTVVGVLCKPVQAVDVASILVEVTHALEGRQQRLPVHRGEPNEQDLRQALNDGRITAWFQPKLCLHSGRIVAAEALARWVSEADGVLPPAMFLPTITRLGLEKALLRQVLTASIKAQRQWLTIGHQITVSVNLPTHLLEQADLPDELLALVEQCGGEAGSLCFELLEDSMTGHLGDYYAGACRLRMKGFALAQDDFGQGMSSVNGLVNTPFSEIKIDRALVDGCSRDPKLGLVLANLIPLIHQLGMKSVAEGVETKEDLEKLIKLKCDMAQGYFISRALQPADFIAFLGPGDGSIPRRF